MKKSFCKFSFSFFCSAKSLRISLQTFPPKRRALYMPLKRWSGTGAPAATNTDATLLLTINVVVCDCALGRLPPIAASRQPLWRQRRRVRAIRNAFAFALRLLKSSWLISILWRKLLYTHKQCHICMCTFAYLLIFIVAIFALLFLPVWRRSLLL